MSAPNIMKTVDADDEISAVTVPGTAALSGSMLTIGTVTFFVAATTDGARIADSIAKAAAEWADSVAGTASL